MNSPAILLVAALVCLLLWFLYRSGYTVLRSMHSVSFVGRLCGRQASFSGCTETMRRIVRFEEARPYRFGIDLQLKKGSLTAELRDKQGNLLFTLSEASPHAEITPDPAMRYTLLFRFAKATGSYSITWE